MDIFYLFEESYYVVLVYKNGCFGMWVPVFQRDLPVTIFNAETLKMEEVCSSVKLVSSTRLHRVITKEVTI